MSRSRSALAAAAAVAIAACSSEDSGRLSIRLTDATGPFEAAVVTIDRITLHGAAGDVVLSNRTTTVDLLTLANEALLLVDDVVVPAGAYSQLRFRITGGYVALVDPSGAGTRIYASSPTYGGLPAGAQLGGELRMPSYGQSGLKVDVAPGALVVRSGAKVLLVDFDVAQSFGHDASGSGAWVMHPVVKGADILLSGNVFTILETADGVTLPTIAGRQVTPADFRAVLTSEAGSAETLPFVAGAGDTFTAFRYLLPGRYTVAVAGPPGLIFETSPSASAVTLFPGGDVAVAFTITSASLPVAFSVTSPPVP